MEIYDEAVLTTTPTLAVNAAFLLEIKEDNNLLRTLLEETHQMCHERPARRVHPCRLSSLLAELRDQLKMHFYLEEAYGYFEDPLSVAPHLSESAELLRTQHCEFYQEICDLAESAEILVSLNGHAIGTDYLLDRVEQFCDRLQDHEAKEDDLMNQAYNVDLGVGD